jgi:hypothetical protein
MTIRLLEDGKPTSKRETWGNYNFDKPSKAVIALDSNDVGIVLWTVGGHVALEMTESGLSSAEELGLFPPAPGLWVWEGISVWHPGHYECPEDGEMELTGSFRLLTPEEGEKVLRNECPWNDDEWKHPVDVKEES